MPGSVRNTRPRRDAYSGLGRVFRTARAGSSWRVRIYGIGNAYCVELDGEKLRGELWHM